MGGGARSGRGERVEGTGWKRGGDWMGDGQRAPYSIPFLEHKCCM